MKVPDTKENMMKCICPECPTYNDCMKQKMGGLFCSKGKATCEFEEMGCICVECPLSGEFNLTSLYYCTLPHF